MLGECEVQEFDELHLLQSEFLLLIRLSPRETVFLG